MTQNDLATTALWDGVVSGHDADERRKLVTKATVALAGTWPFLAVAESQEEFEARLALMQEPIERTVPPEVLGEVLAHLQENFTSLHTARLQATALRHVAARRIEAAEGEQSLPDAYVHVHKHGSDNDDDIYYQVDHVAGPSFLNTVAHVTDHDEAMTKARQYAQPIGLPLYENGRYVEGRLLPLPEPGTEFLDARTGQWVKVAHQSWQSGGTQLSPMAGIADQRAVAQRAANWGDHLAGKGMSDDDHITAYHDWATKAGHNPDDLATLKIYERNMPGIGRARADKIADVYHGQPDTWRTDHARGHVAAYQPDPDALWRYGPRQVPPQFPAQGGQPTAPTTGPAADRPVAGTSIGPDGFPMDYAQGEDRSQIGYANQLTPGQWVVTPGTEWRDSGLPNAATGMPQGARPAPGSNPAKQSSKGQNSDGNGRPLQIPEAWRRGSAPTNWVHDDGGRPGRSVPHNDMARGVINHMNGNGSEYENVELDNYDDPQRITITRNGEAQHWYPSGRTSSRRTATEGIVPTPGPNPYYFNQGTQGIAGPPTFPPDVSLPEHNNHQDGDGPYGDVPPVQSGGSVSDGTVDGQGYSRAAAKKQKYAPGYPHMTVHPPADFGGFELQDVGWHESPDDHFNVGSWPADTVKEKAAQYGRGYMRAHGHGATDVPIHEVTHPSPYWGKTSSARSRLGFSQGAGERTAGKYPDDHPTREELRQQHFKVSPSRPAVEPRGGRWAVVNPDETIHSMHDTKDAADAAHEELRQQGMRETFDYMRANPFPRQSSSHTARNESMYQYGFDHGMGGQPEHEAHPDYLEGHLDGTMARDELQTPEEREWADQRGRVASRTASTEVMGQGLYPYSDRYSVGPDPALGEEHGDGYRDAQYHATRGYDYRKADRKGFNKESEDYRWGYHQAHDHMAEQHERNKAVLEPLFHEMRDQSTPEQMDFLRGNPTGPSRYSSRVASTDGRIVGKCDHCGEPVRYHTERGGHLQHLHNSSPMCADGKTATAVRIQWGPYEARFRAQAHVEEEPQYFRAVPHSQPHGSCAMCGDRATHALAQSTPHGLAHLADVCTAHASQYDSKRAASLHTGVQMLVNRLQHSQSQCTVGSCGNTATHMVTSVSEMGNGRRQIGPVCDEHAQQARNGRIGAVLENPSADNPTGRGADPYRARTQWEGFEQMRPRQRMEDMNANTPTTTPDPIKQGPNANTPLPGANLDEDGPRERGDQSEEDDE